MLRKMRKELYILVPIVAQDSRNAAKASAINLFPVRVRISFRGESFDIRHEIRFASASEGRAGMERGILLENCGRSGNIRAPSEHRRSGVFLSRNYARAKS